MRIGINGRFYRAPVTGVQRFAREVAGRVAAAGDVVLLLPGDVHRNDVALSAPIPSLRGRLTGHAWEQLELPAMARRAGCDVVLHLSGTLPARGAGDVAAIHDVLPLTHPHLFGARFAAWYGFLLRRAAPRAAAILTVSEESRAAIARELAPRRIEVVPQGLAPFDVRASDAQVERARAALDLPRRFLLAIGLGDRRKNLSFLPAVLEAYRVRHGTPPVIVAVGGSASRVHGRVAVPAHPGFRALGRVADDTLHALYTGARALLFPSLAEGFGRPPLEAAACGTPSLIAESADLPGPARWAGLPVPLDPAAWADAIASLLADDRRHASLVVRARAACVGMRWDLAAERVLDVCRDVARSRTMPTRRARARSEA